MKIIDYNNLLEPKNIDAVKEILSNDGIIIYPTDTLYGLGGNFLSIKTMETIDRLKNRNDMPYSAAVSGLPMLERLTDHLPPLFRDRCIPRLPGKFTFLLPIRPELKHLVRNTAKIGVRIPDIPNILKLMEILDTPLITTSVNKSGEKSLNDPEAIRHAFEQEKLGDLPVLMIDKGPLPPSAGSTIYDLTQNPVKCLRQGEDTINFPR